MRARPWLHAPARLARALLPPCAAAAGIVTVIVVPRSAHGITTHAGTSAVAAVADLAAGLGLLTAGLLVWLLRPGGGPGLYVVNLAGLAWFAADWVGWEGGPALLRSMGMAVEPFFLAFAVHIVMAAPDGRLRSRRDRIAVRAMYVATVITSVGRALVRDPFLDPYCWSNCRDNVFLLSPRPSVARAIDDAWVMTSLAVGLLLAVWAIGRIASATPTARRTLLPVLLPGFLLGTATAAHAVELLQQRPEDPRDAVFSALFQARAWTAAALAVGVGVVLLRAWRARAALARLAADLGEAPAPGSLGLALARATGDVSLEVMYPLPGGGRYVDASGRTVEIPTAGAGRGRTPITRDGSEVALIVHDPATVDAEQLRAEVGAAARLAIENERLQAEVLAQLEDLRASRVRVVEAGDAERRRLERNLHDGAQQRLLALTYDLRLARVGADGDDLSALLTSAEQEALAAVTDLRDLAHGIYPAVLTQSGIGPALWTLADTAPLPVEVGATPDRRFPEAAERTAFVVVYEAVDAAHRRGSSYVGVRVSHDDDHLTVEVNGAGSGPFVHVTDRVGALGGRLTIDRGTLRAEIPCG